MGIFWRHLGKAKLKLKLGFSCLAILLLLTPGKNKYDSLVPHPQKPPVRNAPQVLSAISSFPINIGSPPPLLSAKGAIVIDSNSAAVLYQKNPDLQLLPASTTKIMTALVALDQYDLQDTVTIKQADGSIGHSMQLVKGEKISVENLLYGILVESGNDAAFALAQHHPSGYSGFIKLMNQKASQFNLKNTHFRNVSGVEQYGHLTTVRDLAILAKEALKNPIFAKMVATPHITVSSTDGRIVHPLSNINQLLGIVPGIKGVKTGWTEHAGECLVAATERNGQEIITVVLGSADRFGETQALINWAFSNHKWEELEL